MTDQRKPGKVDEETIPLSEQKGSKNVQGSDAPIPTSSLAANHEKSIGKVTEPTEAIPPEETDKKVEIESESLLPKSSLWSVTFWLLVIFVNTWLVYITADAVLGIWQESVWVGVLMAVFSSALFFAVSILFWREYRSIKTVDELIARSQLVDKALETNDTALIKSSLANSLENIRKHKPKLINEFEQASVARDSVSDYLKQFDNIVLTRLDEKADKVIQSEAYKSALAVAISPHPSLDAVLVLWRSLVLAKTIALIYGVEISGISALIMLKRIIATAIIAAGMEEIGSVGVDAVGNSLLSNAFKSLGEGTVIAWRVYRLGKKTKQMCRPI